MSVNLKIFSIILICLISSIHSEEIPYEANYTAVSTAIAQVCDEFFIKKSTIFDVLIYGEMTQHLSDVTNGLIEQIGSKALMNLQFIYNTTSFDHKLKRSAVIFFSSQ